MSKLRFILLFFISALFMGCGKMTPQQIEQAKINECFSNSDLRNCDRIDFISFFSEENAEKKKMRFSCLCRYKDINTILYKRYDFYEAVYRIYKDISLNQDKYNKINMDLSEDEIFETEHHYIQVRWEDAVTITLCEDTFLNVIKIIYDAETGDIWLGETDELYSVECIRNNTDGNFIKDPLLLEYVEGLAPFKNYKTFVEDFYYENVLPVKNEDELSAEKIFETGFQIQNASEEDIKKINIYDYFGIQ